MEFIYLVFFLLGVGYLIAPIVGVVMAIATRDRVRQLELRVAELQRAGASGAAGAAAQPRPQASPPGSQPAESTSPPPFEPTWPAADEPISKTAPPPDIEPLWVPGRPVPIVPPREGDAAIDAASEPEPQAAEPPPPPPPPPPQPPGLTPQEHVAGLEERFGTRWVVWVGGVALALGGIFLVKYTIEAGLIGPRPAHLPRRAARGRAGGRRGMDAAQGAALRLRRTCRPRTSRASSPRPAPRSPMPPPTRPMRSTNSSAPARRSSCSASSRWRRSRPPCCMDRCSPGSASSALT